MLSIIIPTYNSEHTIKKCINSILNIHKIKFEIIIIDDGSSDSTLHINNTYADKYSNITSLHQLHEGVSEARNKGIRHAKGSWISFIDSDDSINAKNLELIYKSHCKPCNDLIISNINLNGKNVGLNNISKKISNIKNFTKNNYPIYKNLTIMDNSGKIYNMSVIKRYKLTYIKHLNYGEDFTFTLNFLNHMHYNNVVQTKLSFYNYKVTSNSSVMTYDKYRIRNEIIILKTLRKLFNIFNLSLVAWPWIKLRIAYNILLNDLNHSNNHLRLLSKDKHNIFKLHLISSNKFNYKKNECLILKFLLKQPSILLLFIALKIIRIRSKLINMHKL